ncbi:pyridoxal-dependent decarboxylase [Dactylosporangium sp. NPDC050688]|uniref:pyridoxal-dependent decarboxylase n=1 Tax=Dactylosporangium sp. NPDC050688 TaxID=3157217 RepID=UPI0033CC8320
MNGRQPLPGPVASLLGARDTRRMTAIGEPYATDLDRPNLIVPLLRHALRAEQDADTGPTVGWFTDQVVRQIAQLLQAPSPAWQGAFCDSLTAATIRTLLPLRQAEPGLVLYRSTASHGHVAAAAHILGLDTVIVPTDRRGVLNPAQLAAEIRQRRPSAVAAVATLGTPAAGALDDVAAIRAAVDGLPIRAHLHVDAPLEGLALAARAAPQTPVGFAAGADSIVVAGDQFLPVPLPCAVALHRTQHLAAGPALTPVAAPGPIPVTAWAPAVDDIEAAGCGSGHAAVLLWHALQECGTDGLARRARRSDALAGYTLRRLHELSWPGWRHPGSMTVLLQPPSALLRRRWSLQVDAGWARIVCVPGVTEAHIDRFIAELSHEPPPAPAAASVAPSPVHSPSRSLGSDPDPVGQSALATDVPASPGADRARTRAA